MFGRFRKKSPEPELPPPRPGRLTYVIGDIHGSATLLEKMLAMIEADRAGAEADLVCLGDYVDRGPDSAGVLRRLSTLAPKGVKVTCLMGNHERMMLDFLDAPEDAGPRWLANGGTDTVVSFAIGRGRETSEGSGLTAVRDMLRDSMGSDLVTWIQARPLSFLTGTLGCVHAITDPMKPWTEQTPETLLWGRPHKNLRVRPDGIWVAHGHTIVPAPELARGRIALDTGAYRTGNLTALRAEGTATRFMAASLSD